VVLDTSVLIGDPGCLNSFAGVDVVIPFTVIEELDSLKTRPDDVGRAARTALRTIEEHRIRAGGSLAHPFAIGDPAAEGTLQVEINGVQKHLLIEHGLDPHVPDNRIIGAALGQAMHAPTRMVSNDAALRIKAAHLGLEAVEHHPIGRSSSTRPAGWITIETGHAEIDRLYHHESLPVTELPGASAARERLRRPAFGSSSAPAAVSTANSCCCTMARPRRGGCGRDRRSRRFALELLLDPEVSVVALDGRAGTGKTLLAIAAGLEQVVEQKAYEKLAVYRPLVPVGRADVGFLPGGLDEKLDPWMSAIHDAIVALTDQRSSHDAHRLVDELVGRNQLSLESVTFLRGRSLHRQIVVVDEAQNLEPTTLKTVLTRIGEGTKVIFTGDTSQIDAPYLGESNNALAVLIQAFGGQSCFGHVTLTACERSTVASLAAELL
jgi:PhoH-like ATPase